MNDTDFANLVESIQQAGQIKQGRLKPGRVFEYSPLDIKMIRKKLHKSQQEFALMIGVSVATLQNWEQGRRRPQGPARALLKIASEHPDTVAEALGREIPAGNSNNENEK
jgi:putative transcriptional regulator